MRAFLIPGVFGDEPRLRHLRDVVRGTIDLDLLHLPTTDAPNRILADMAETARGLVTQIDASRRSGPVAIVGYSFGASMALEVACQLTRSGRTVSFLGILDGPFEPPVLVEQRRGMGTIPCKLLKAAAVEVTECMDTTRRSLLPSPVHDATHDDRMEPMRRALLWHLRSKALLRWTPETCAAPGVHVHTGSYGPDNRRRWAGLCPRLAQVEVGVDHEHLLGEDTFHAVVTALTQATTRIGRSPGRALVLPAPTAHDTREKVSHHPSGVPCAPWRSDTDADAGHVGAEAGHSTHHVVPG